MISRRLRFNGAEGIRVAIFGSGAFSSRLRRFSSGFKRCFEGTRFLTGGHL